MTAVAAPGVPSVRRWRVAVGVTFGLGGLLVSTWGPRLPSIKADLGLGDGALGLLVIGGTLTAIVGLVCSSALHARLGGRRGLIVMTLLAALGVAVTGIGSGLHAPLLAEAGFLGRGFGVGVLDVMINVEGSGAERAGRGVIMPLLHACWSAGAVLGSGVGAAAAAIGIDPAWQFSAEAVLAVAVVAIVSRWIPEVDVPAGPPRPAAPLRQRVGAWLGAWRDPRLLLIGLVMLGVELGEGSASTWLTLGAAQGHHLSDAVAALYFTVFAASETAFRAVSGPIVQRIGRVAAVRATTAAGVVGIAMFVLGGPAWVVLAGTVLWAVGVSMGFPLGMSAAAESGPNAATRVSVVASVGYLAGLGGPPVVGYLSQAVGLTDSFWLLAAWLGVALLAAGALRTGTSSTIRPSVRIRPQEEP